MGSVPLLAAVFKGNSGTRTSEESKGWLKVPAAQYCKTDTTDPLLQEVSPSCDLVVNA